MGVPAAVHESRQDRRIRSMGSWVLMGTIGSVGLAVIGTRIGSIPRPGDYQWWFSIPGGRSTLAGLGFYLSVFMLVGAWVGLGFHAYRGRFTVTHAWVVLGMWGVPLLVGPPLFSRDIYSYIGQGLLAHHGLNPYSVAPSALGNGPVLDSIARVWHNTASPYGPLFVMVTHAAAVLSGGSLLVEVLVFRLTEMVGVVLIMVSLPRLARRLGTDPGLALWMGTLSPLALFSFIASGHNDALMVGLLLAGVLLAADGRLVVGLVLCALAATIKLPAAAAVVFIAADRLRGSQAHLRWRVVAETIVVPLAVIASVTAVSGFGWTWLGPTALHVPTELRVLSTPAVSLGVFFFTSLHMIGVPVVRSATVTVTQFVCELVAVSGTLWMVLRPRNLEVVRLLGLALVLIVVGSPTVWPWYLMWGVAVLAATGAQRSKVLAAVAGLAMLVVGPSGTPLLGGDAFVVVALAALGGCAWLVWKRHWWNVVSGYAL